MTFNAGTYVLRTAAGVFLGQAEEGFNIEHSYSIDEIRGDNFAQSLQDGVYRGGNAYIDVTLTEYNLPSLLAFIWPWSETIGHSGVPGTLAGDSTTGRTTALKLTALLGTPAATIGPILYTMSRAIVSPGQPIRLSFNSRLRRIALRIQLLPFLDGSTYYWFKPSIGTPETTYPASGGFTAGPYSASYNVTVVKEMGTTEDGFELEWVFHAEPVTGDNMGDTIQDYIYRGGDCFLSATFLESAVAALAVVGGYTGAMSTIGERSQIDTHHGAIILTRVAVAGITTPTTLSATTTIIAPGYPIRQLLAPRLRRLPLRFQLLPDTLTKKWFTITA